MNREDYNQALREPQEQRLAKLKEIMERRRQQGKPAPSARQLVRFFARDGIEISHVTAARDLKAILGMARSLLGSSISTQSGS